MNEYLNNLNALIKKKIKKLRKLNYNEFVIRKTRNITGRSYGASI